MKRFVWRAAGVALWLQVSAFAGQLALRHILSSKSLLSPDALLFVSFGAEAVAFLLIGFLVSFLAGGFARRELLVSAGILAVIAFAVLHRMKPPSFSYDKFFADTRELVIWSGLTGVGALLLGLWGASFGVLLGAAETPDLRFAFEAGIARTHLRLNRRTAAMLVGLGLVPPGLLFAAGVFARAYDETVRSRALGAAAPTSLSSVRGDAAAVILSAAAVVAALFLAGRWLQARAQLAHLQPGQRRKRPATVVMTAISIAGVSVGVWALTVVLSVMSGFEADLKKKILGTNAHALLLKYSSDFSEWKSVMPKVVSVPGVAGASPFILNEVILSQGQTPTGAELKGIDPETAGSVNELPRQVIAGELSWISDPTQIPVRETAKPRDKARLLGDDQYLQDTFERKEAHPDELAKGIPPETLQKMPGICVGKEMSHALRAWVGDVIQVITPLGDMGPTGPIPRSKSFRVACILYSGMYEYDSKFAYIGIPEAQKFFRMGESITGLELKFKDVDAARAEGRRVVAALGGFPYRAKDWAELNRNLFSALKLEKLAMAIILTFIVLVACFNILSTLIMLVLEKTKEISILKSMGARDSSVMKIFVLEGLVIGAIGTAMGLLLGLASCSFIERFGLQLDPDVYYISNLPVNVDSGQFVMVAFIAVALSYLATLYPATKASRLSPVDGLRED
ncbi:MAG: ABC transporter permease [Deltaproteobacteria bacterium]|nr:MAG: ABC transporter permease [Deltaproteobacteria bacterium]